MKRYHAMLWGGLLLFAAGIFRVIAPFSVSLGTLTTGCGNAIAYLDGQDKSLIAAGTLQVCERSLKLASEEGLGALGVGLVLTVVGFVLLRKRRSVRRGVRGERARGQNPYGEDRRRSDQNARFEDRRRADQSAYREDPSQYREARRESRESAARGEAPTINVSTNNDLANAEIFEEFMRLGRATRPRTVLSFFGILFAALIAGSVIAIALFLQHPSLSQYIAWILAFDAVIAVVLVVGVFVTITKDPARLMLSEIATQNSVALPRPNPKPKARRTGSLVERKPEETKVVETESRQTARTGRRWDDPQP